MVASKQGGVAVCQVSEGASVEVPSTVPEGLEHMTQLPNRSARSHFTSTRQQETLSSHSPWTVQGGQAISEKCSIEPPPHYFQQLTFPFQRLCFPQLGATYPASYEFRL